MLIWGQANPEAMKDDYNGIYLNLKDMQDMVKQIDDHKAKGKFLPVHIEHAGDPVGHVVSAWVEKDTLQCVLELNNQTLESAIAKQLVKDGFIKELSLGYLLDIQHTDNGINTKSKQLQEISIVKKGARDHCKIKGITNTPSSSRI